MDGQALAGWCKTTADGIGLLMEASPELLIKARGAQVGNFVAQRFFSLLLPSISEAYAQAGAGTAQKGALLRAAAQCISHAPAAPLQVLPWAGVGARSVGGERYTARVSDAFLSVGFSMLCRVCTLGYTFGYTLGLGCGLLGGWAAWVSVRSVHCRHRRARRFRCSRYGCKRRRCNRSTPLRTLFSS